MKIILFRHDKSNFAQKWLKSADEAKLALEKFSHSRVTSENYSGVAADTVLANVCLTSNLARAVDTARLIGFRNSKQCDLFNESELPHPDSLYIPLPWKRLGICTDCLLWVPS